MEIQALFNQINEMNFVCNLHVDSKYVSNSELFNNVSGRMFSRKKLKSINTSSWGLENNRFLFMPLTDAYLWEINKFMITLSEKSVARIK